MDGEILGRRASIDHVGRRPSRARRISSVPTASVVLVGVLGCFGVP